MGRSSDGKLSFDMYREACSWDETGMTALERDSWFNTGAMVALVFASLVWKGPNLKVRAIHAAILFGAFLLVRAAYTHFTRPKPQAATPDSDE